MFDVVYMDLCCSYKDHVMDKKHYFLIDIDDYSRFLWAQLLQLKFEIIFALKSFIFMVKTQFSSHVKVVRSSNSREFFLTLNVLSYFNI